MHAADEKPPEPVLEGKLEDLPLADILQVLQASGKSGWLLLKRAVGQWGMIVLRKGRIVQAVESETYCALGDQLVEHGRISRPQLQEALTYMAPFPGMRLGDAIVDLGFLSRGAVDDEVRAQITSAVERLMTWRQADFEFRVGLGSLGRHPPDFATDFVFEKGMEPDRILVRAAAAPPRTDRDDAPEAPAASEVKKVEEEARLLALSLEEERPASDSTDPGHSRAAYEYLSLSEELFATHGRGEMGLLLLRYASDLYSDGALMLCRPDGFKVLGQFGSPLAWGESRAGSARAFYRKEECPVLDMVAISRRPYAGLVRATPDGILMPAGTGVPDTVAVLIIPIVVLGASSLLLICRTAVAGAPDARALVALARQVGIAFENLSLRDLAGRKEGVS